MNEYVRASIQIIREISRKLINNKIVMFCVIIINYRYYWCYFIFKILLKKIELFI